jgi:hypothetical protein
VFSPLGSALHDRDGVVSRCHAETRNEVVAEIKSWAKGKGPPVCWLYGPAGHGKSAISHAIAEWCHKKKRLAGDYFFFRGEERNDIRHLIPTLAHRLSRTLPSKKEVIDKRLKEMIPGKALSSQFNELIIGTLDGGVFGNAMRQVARPLVIVIDGLDECDSKDSMAEFVDTVIKASSDLSRINLRILLASRFEEHIRKEFEAATIYRLNLEKYDATEDILKFFRSRFADILMKNQRIMQCRSSPWPSEDNYRRLSQKCQGSFIFAGTLMSIMDKSGHPEDKLQEVLSAEAGLDSLYIQVFTSAFPKDASPHSNFMHILGAILLIFKPLPITSLQQLIAEQRVVHDMLVLQSLLKIPGTDKQPIKLYHTSLRDFLLTKERSGTFYINPSSSHITIAIDCLSLLREPPVDGEFYEGQHQIYASLHWCDHVAEGLSNCGDPFFNCDRLMKCVTDFSAHQYSWTNTCLLHKNMEELEESLHSTLSLLKASLLFLTALSA